MSLTTRLERGAWPGARLEGAFPRPKGHARFAATPPALPFAAVEARDRVDRVRGLLPDDLERVQIWRFQTTDRPVFRFNLAAPWDRDRLYRFTEDVVVRRTPPCAPCYSRTCQRHAGIMGEIPVSEALAAVERRLVAGGGRA